MMLKGLSIPEDEYSPILQWLGWQSTPTITNPPSPAFSAPIAPQTQAAMITWNPDQQAEAYAQRGVQYVADTNYYGALLQEKSGAGNAAAPDPAPKSDNTLTWVLAGVAGVLLLTTIFKR